MNTRVAGRRPGRQLFLFLCLPLGQLYLAANARAGGVLMASLEREPHLHRRPCAAQLRRLMQIRGKPASRPADWLNGSAGLALALSTWMAPSTPHFISLPRGKLPFYYRCQSDYYHSYREAAKGGSS